MASDDKITNVIINSVNDTIVDDALDDIIENTTTPNIKNGHDRIIKLFGSSGDGVVVDVVGNYDWAVNKRKVLQDSKFSGGIPCLYAIEYKQKYGVTATNLMNSILAMASAGNAMIENTGLAEKYNEYKNKLVEAISGLAGKNETYADAMAYVQDVAATLKTEFASNKSQLLNPYAHLYALEKTNVKFSFPYFGENAASFSISNDFSAEGSKGLLSKMISESIADLANGGVAIAGDVQELATAFNTNTQGFVMYNIEKAKAFNFPASGKTVSVRFPLFNTIKKDNWQKHYKFIVGFALRNMLYRKDNVSYYPPMFYDVSIPGWGRMPYCYVKQFVAKPVGMIRPLSFGSKTGETLFGKEKLTVHVPEAWVIQIDFTSLIADSANQFLSSIIDLPIEAKVVEYEARNIS